MRIRDPVWKKFGFEMENIRIGDLGMEKIGSGINIPDPQHWFLLQLSSFKLNQRVLYGSFQLIKCYYS
jgi:hypothetical protein